MIEEIEVTKLQPLEKNPRRITKDQLEKLSSSMLEDPAFLQRRPVLVNLTDGVYQVYAGNQRLAAARKLGWKAIHCIIDNDLSQELMKSRTIKDNQTYGEFDFDILANEYEIQDLLDWGFTEDQLSIDTDTILGNDTGEDKETDQKEEKCPNCGFNLCRP